MPPRVYIRPTHSLPPPIPPLLQPQPPIAPAVPPVHIVDLMTEAGSSMFDAVWRAKEAKLVECPALTDSRPEYTTTYDIEPHAELLGFDDADWQARPHSLVTETRSVRQGDSLTLRLAAGGGQAIRFVAARR